MINKKERTIVYLVSCVHALVHMQMLIFAAVNLEMVQQFGSTVEAIGFIGTIGYFLFGFGSLPAGFLIDKVGARKVLLLSVATMAVADIIIAFSGTVIGTTAGLALLGIGGSMYHPAGLGLISRNVEHKGYAMGVHGTIGNIGVALGLLVAGLVASYFGWQMAYLWPVVPMLIMVVVFSVIRFGDVIEGEPNGEKAPKAVFPKSMFAIMMLVISLQAISGFIYRASNTFMPAYTGQKLSTLFSGLDATARGGILTSMILITGAFGQYIVGRLTRKHSLEWLQLVATAMVAPLLIGVSLLAGLPMLGSAMGFAFVFYGLQPLGNALVAKYSPSSVRGRSYGLSFSLSFGLGAFGSAFAGAIANRVSFDAIYLYLAAFALFSTAIAFAVNKIAKASAAEKTT
jgi:MFS family permease